jgi:hypothetical protein
VEIERVREDTAEINSRDAVHRGPLILLLLLFLLLLLRPPFFITLSLSLSLSLSFFAFVLSALVSSARLLSRPRGHSAAISSRIAVRERTDPSTPAPTPNQDPTKAFQTFFFPIIPRLRTFRTSSSYWR